jgi:pteridine reductase
MPGPGTSAYAQHTTRPRPTALVTGAAKRVGRAIALQFARAGYDIIATYRSSAEEAAGLKHEITTLGGECTLLALDIADLDAVEAVGAALAAQQPRLDVLVHNASEYQPKPLREINAAHALRMYNINALAPLLLTKALAPLLEKSPLAGGGSIVAMADMHVLGRPRREFAAYAMSKAAIVEMVRSLARELAPRIRVNAVAPGVIAWPERGYESDAQTQQAYLSRVPLARAGTPEDAASAVLWLARDATYITGEIIRIDGGRWLA